MAFGRRGRGDQGADAGLDAESQGPQVGPYDSTDFGADLDAIAAERLDLGSVIVPVPAGGQLQVELAEDGTPQAVHLAVDPGRVTVTAYAAPKSAGQWREVATDLAESLRADGADVSIGTGPWGREVVALAQGADLRFLGVDGPRWMVRVVVAGPPGSGGDRTPLVETAREVLAETIVRRGDDPHPVRTPLPVVLPQQLAEQLAAAHREQVAAAAADQAAQVYAPQSDPHAQYSDPHAQHSDPYPQHGDPYAQHGAPAPFGQYPQQPRRGADGSAMQQLGL